MAGLGPRGKPGAGCGALSGAEGGALLVAAAGPLGPRGQTRGSRRGGLPDLPPGSGSASLSARTGRGPLALPSLLGTRERLEPPPAPKPSKALRSAPGRWSGRARGLRPTL